VAAPVEAGMAPRVERRLAAILAADVVGYGRLVGADEAGTIARLRALRKVFIEPLVAEYRGRVVKLMGDGALVEFASAVDAVECAVAIQKAVAEREAGEHEDRRLQFRIGINLGDIVVEDGDILGDGVNVAARLEGLAEPGGICVARTVYNHVRGKLALAFAPMGAHRVKNIAEPVEVWRVALDGAKPKQIRALRWARPKLALAAAAVVLVLAIGSLALWQWTAGPVLTGTSSSERDVLAMPTGPSLAVLPFDSFSGDPEQQYFADGLVEDILTRLSRFSDLKVIGRNATFQYKGQPVDVRAVGKHLGARYVLEGSVRRSGDIVRITVQLLDAEDASHVWAERYDRQLTAANVFSIQDEIVQGIVSALGGAYGVLNRTALEQEARTDNLDAYRCVLLSYAYDLENTALTHLAARTCLERAVELDPDYADAWAALAMLYVDEHNMGWNPNPGLYDPLERALSAAQRAVKLAPNNPTAHSRLAFVHFARGDLDKFRVHGERAVALNPNDGDILAYTGAHMIFSGDIDRGLPLVDKAIELNPGYHPGWWDSAKAVGHYVRGEYEQALEAHRYVNMPDFFYAHIWPIAINGMLGRKDAARASLRELERVYPRFTIATFRKEYAHFHPPEAMMEHIIEGLRRGGMPEGAERPA
jgi:adenylate cyclase